MPRLIDKQNLFGVIESLDEQISKHFQISWSTKQQANEHLKLNSFEITFRFALEKRSSLVMRNKVPIIKPY